MKRLVMLVVSIAAASILASCDLFSGLAGGAAGTDDAPFVYFAESSGGSIDLSLSAAAGRSASVVFTTGPYEGLAAPTATARDSSDVPAAASRLSAQDAFSDRLRSYARENANAYIPPIRPRFSTTGDPAHDVAGATPSEASFYVIANSSSSVDFDVISSSCRAVRDDTTFSDTRTRTLSVWVADDCWDLGSTKKHAVNQTMVDAIAEKFFGASSDPDTSIYAWVTGMLGDEWGVHDESTRIGFGTYDLIAKSDNITILLADIGSDDADDGGIVGYFYPVDTFAGADNSNERIMFIIDAVMYSNPDDSGISSNEPGYSDNGWSDEDYWAEQVFSTLAHEFQHMIHFYQKGVLRGGDYFNEATWIDELCAMQVEDLLADKLGVAGPRGMDPADYSAGVSGNIYGRLPEYLLFPDVTPYDWDTAADAELTRYYSWAYAFGAYLTRNYGGSEFVRRLVQSASTDAGAVAAAASAFSGRDESIVGLLRRWGAAVLLSHRTDAPAYYRYNSGGAFSSSSGGLTYNLGSINMYNYLCLDAIDTDGDDIGDADLAEPYAFSSATIGDLYGGAYSNAFMDLGDPSSSSDWRFVLPAGMYATVVID